MAVNRLAVVQPWRGSFKHPIDSFDPANHAAHVAGRFPQPHALEAFAWDYELLAHLEELAGDRLTLHGGAAAALYLPIEAQRASVDIDLFFDGSQEEFDALIQALRQRWPDASEAYFKFDPHVPKEPRRLLPLRTFHTTCPSPVGHVSAAGRPGTVVKVEAILRAAPVRAAVENVVLPFAKTGPHMALPLNHLIGAKVLALAVGETGVDAGNQTALIKHIYDVYALQAQLTLNTAQAVRDLRPALQQMLEFELGLAKPHKEVRDVVTAVGIFLPTMELTEWRDAARAFGANLLQRSLSEDEWSLRWRFVRYFAMAVGGRADDIEFVETRRRLPRLAVSKLTAAQRKDLVKVLAAEVVKWDIPATHVYRTERPDVLFCELAFRGQLLTGLALVEGVLGKGWDA